MTYDHELVLIEEINKPKKGGFFQPEEIKQTVLCGLKNVYGSDFFKARSAGQKLEHVFVINSFEYEGQQVVEFEGKRYKIAKTYRLGANEIELTVESVLGVD